jgi:hypothetical protein
MPIREVHTLNTLFSKVRSTDSCGKIAESSVFTFRTLKAANPRVTATEWSEATWLGAEQENPDAAN